MNQIQLDLANWILTFFFFAFHFYLKISRITLLTYEKTASKAFAIQLIHTKVRDCTLSDAVDAYFHELFVCLICN